MTFYYNTIYVKTLFCWCDLSHVQYSSKGRFPLTRFFATQVNARNFSSLKIEARYKVLPGSTFTLTGARLCILST